MSVLSSDARRRPAGGSRFWKLAAVVVAANFLLIGLILLRGDQSDLRPTSVTPLAGAGSVSTGQVIRMTFRRSMDPDSLRSAFRLDPPIEGSTSANPHSLTFTPSTALLPDTIYTATLSSGVRESDGRESRQDYSATFRTAASRVVVLRGALPNLSIWAVDVGSGQSWPLASALSTVPAVTLSPDGAELAYVSASSGQKWSLNAVKLDGSARREIVKDGEGIVSSLAWSPRGDVIAFEQHDTFGGVIGGPKIWLARADGSQVSLLYGRGEESGEAPIWAPDGRKLSFYESRYGAIELFDFTTTLLPIRSDVRASGSFAPDGRSLVFEIRTGDTGGREQLEIAAIGSRSATIRSLTDGSATDSRPAWSPAGNLIAFVRLSPTGTAGIWIVRPDGSDARPLQEESGWLYSRPVWSPDGRSVAFSRDPMRAGGSAGESQLWVASTDGSAHQIAAGGRIVAWAP